MLIADDPSPGAEIAIPSANIGIDGAASTLIFGLDVEREDVFGVRLEAAKIPEFLLARDLEAVFILISPIDDVGRVDHAPEMSRSGHSFPIDVIEVAIDHLIGFNIAYFLLILRDEAQRLASFAKVVDRP